MPLRRSREGKGTGRDARRAAIQALEAARGTSVIAYVTSTRPRLEIHMAMDVIPIVYEHLRLLPSERAGRKIDLLIHSNGGDGVVPWRLVTLIREYCDEFSVLVPNRAFSAATLTALGADSVIMHPMGMLGPTDPTVANEFNPPNERAPGELLGISVEDVSSYFALVKEDVGIRHEDELVQALGALSSRVHPLALGNVKRLTSQSRMLGEKLLRTRNREDLDEHDITGIIKKLTSELYYHGHPINRVEAREDLGLTFVEDASAEVADKMWAVFEAFDGDMELNEEFLPVQEAMEIAGVLAPPTLTHENMLPHGSTMPALKNVPLPVVNGAYVQSVGRSDVYAVDFEVTLRREAFGQIEANVAVVNRGWRQD
jgi:Serine dehydrogenase proteinase